MILSYSLYHAGNSEDRLLPTLVVGLSEFHIVGVACGGGDAHTLAVDKDGKINLYISDKNFRFL